MKTFLVVETGYEYNDEGYDVRDSYEVKQGFADKGKAIDLMQKMNIETIEKMGEYFQDNDGAQIIPWKIVEIEVETGRELSDVRKAKAVVQKALEEARKIAKDAFAAVSKELFDEHPILDSFQWHQYTPYFNDGDTCEFSANIDYPSIAFTDGEEVEDADCIEFAKKPQLNDKEKAIKAVLDFLSAFDDDDYKSMFGDHQTVKVLRNGKKIDVDLDDFDHE